jgi:Uma2 family endonuclease
MHEVDGWAMSLEEFLALPEDTRREIVDGVVRPMTRARKLHRRIQRKLAEALDAQMPGELDIENEEIVILGFDPAHARVPDIAVYRADTDPSGQSNHTKASDVVLVVEVVSPTTAHADRIEKPREYADAGITSFWRVEIEPRVVVHTFRLANGRYAPTGQFASGDVILDEALPWVAVPVDGLVGRFTNAL